MSKSTGKKFLSDLKLYSDYLKWRPEFNRYETWDEACEDIIQGHREKFKHIDLEEEFSSALESMREMKLLASQRSLQFRHKQLMKNSEKIYNCVVNHLCRNRCFQEVFYLSLCGCGCGSSLLKPFVDNLSRIQKRTKGVKTFVVPDSIEGWADACGVLLSSYFIDKQPFPEYSGYEIRFDYSKIRSKGAKISGAFKAPGPDGLKLSMERIEALWEKWIDNEGSVIRPILAFDTLCFLADAVLSGNLRRSALCMIVDPRDEEMIMAKTGSWRQDNPQRARSNNSVLIPRESNDREFFDKIVNLNDGDNDIGFVFGNTLFDCFNPCFTKEMRVLTTDGYFSFAELVEKQNLGEDIYLIQDLRAKGEVVDGEEAFSVDNKLYGYISKNKCEKVGLTGLKQPILKILTELGDVLRVTPNHKIATWNGFKEAKDIVSGDILLSYSPHTNKLWVTVKSVETDGFEDVYCLEENNHRTIIVEDIVVARCFEIGMIPVNTYEDVSSISYEQLSEWTNQNEDLFGMNFCNLCEINAEKCKDKETFFRLCQDAAILGTLQSTYNTFPYLTKASEDICKREALLGVSITGWMNNPKMFDPKMLREGVEIIRIINKSLAEKLGSNQAARLTTTKPSGNACKTFSTKIKTSMGNMSSLEIFKHCTDNSEYNPSVDLASLPEIKKDLMVYDKNNELQKISALYVNGFAETYEIEFEDGYKSSFTDNHKFLTKNGWVRTEDLIENDEIIAY